MSPTGARQDVTIARAAWGAHSPPLHDSRAQLGAGRVHFGEKQQSQC